MDLVAFVVLTRSLLEIWIITILGKYFIVGVFFLAFFLPSFSGFDPTFFLGTFSPGLSPRSIVIEHGTATADPMDTQSLLTAHRDTPCKRANKASRFATRSSRIHGIGAELQLGDIAAYSSQRSFHLQNVEYLSF